MQSQATVTKANPLQGGDAKLRGSTGRSGPGESAELPPKTFRGGSRGLVLTTGSRRSQPMLRKLTQRVQSEESGFTLIELLVVILIIGILAAIALPAFLGQQKKGQDASAKSDARNLVSQIEACFANEQAYSSCGVVSGKIGGDSTGLPLGSGQGQVTVDVTTPAGGYTVTAKSKSNNTFSIVKDANGVTSRTCGTAATGGCPTGGSW